MSAAVEQWEEQVGDQVFVYRGERNSTDHSKRTVVGIRSRASLRSRQLGARIPLVYREALLTSWDDSRSNVGTKEIVERYLADPARSLYLYGPVGGGKTFAACAIGNALLERGKAVLFQTISELLLDLRDTFSVDEVSEKSILRPLSEVEFLILDELGDLPGNRERTASAFSASRMLVLLDSRWRTGRSTIMTSNLDLQQLEGWIDDARLASRIAGACALAGVVEIGGRDLRLAAVPAEEGKVAAGPS